MVDRHGLTEPVLKCLVHRGRGPGTERPGLHFQGGLEPLHRCNGRRGECLDPFMTEDGASERPAVQEVKVLFLTRRILAHLRDCGLDRLWRHAHICKELGIGHGLQPSGATALEELVIMKRVVHFFEKVM